MLVSDAALKIIERALRGMLTMVMLVERAENCQPDKENRGGRQRCEQARPWAGHHALELYHNSEAVVPEIIESVCRTEPGFFCRPSLSHWKRRTIVGNLRHERLRQAPRCLPSSCEPCRHRKQSTAEFGPALE